MPRPPRTEIGYPASYRSAEVQQIVRVVRARSSLQVCGGGGSGKSHLLRFVAFHPALAAALGAGVRRLYLDCNAAISDDPAGIFRALLLETEPDAAAASTPDALATLRAALAAQLQPGDKFLIILDRFERIPGTAQPGVLDGLRHVRDYLDRQVSYVLGSRAPAPVASLSEEFEDLLATPPVLWIGPLSPADAAWSLGALAAEYQEALPDAAQAALSALSGGYPRLLRAAALAWFETAPEQRVADLTLLDHPQVARVCEAIWRDLDPSAQDTFRRLVRGDTPEVAASSPLALQQLVTLSGGAAHVRIPLLGAFAQRQTAPFQLSLTALEEQLWRLLREQPGSVLRRAELVSALYGASHDGVNDEALTAVAARLRRKLEQAEYGTVEALRGQGYRFTPRGLDYSSGKT